MVCMVSAESAGRNVVTDALTAYTKQRPGLSGTYRIYERNYGDWTMWGVGGGSYRKRNTPKYST